MRTFRLPQPRVQNFRGLALFTSVFVVLFILWQAIGFVVDWYWFKEVGYEIVFSVTVLTQLKLAVLFGAVFFIVFYTNLFLALKFSSRPPDIEVVGATDFPPTPFDNPAIKVVILIISLLFSAFAALNAMGEWENFLRFTHASPFGVTDPVFERDIGFYVFRLPFLNHVYGWLFFVLLFTTAATAFVYLSRRSFLLVPPRVLRATPAARTHLTILTALLFIWGTFGLWLTLNEILFAKRGVVFDDPDVWHDGE